MRPCARSAIADSRWTRAAGRCSERAPRTGVRAHDAAPARPHGLIAGADDCAAARQPGLAIALLQQLHELSSRKRGAHVKPLSGVASDALQERELRRILYAFRDDAEPEDARHRDDGFDDRRRRMVGQHLCDERAIDLDRIDWKALQIAQRRIARAEIVER